MDAEHGDVVPVAESAGGRWFGSPAVVGGLMLVGFVALAALVALLVMSPASFVGLLPGWFTKDGSGRTVVWIFAGLSAAGATVLAVRGDRAGPLRSVVITVLVVAAAGFGLYALKSAPAEENPIPENACVVYSGGDNTCPGG